jgi:hypothetical protein
MLQAECEALRFELERERVRRVQVRINDDVWDECVSGWASEGDALRALVGAVSGLYESYRGGPFGVCQRTVRDAERQLFHHAQRAKERFSLEEG